MASENESRVKFSPPLIGESEIAEVVDTLRSEWITAGPKTRQFELDFQKHVHAPGALGLNSCTAALHAALLTLNIGQGDEVITSPMTFAASVNVIEHVGARPVLVDVDCDTLNISDVQIEAAITPRTRAIIAVHFSGHPVELDSIKALAERYHLTIIEDAAHALGARYKGVPIGGNGNPTAFSFYATKNLTTGEGGMLTGDPEFLDNARTISLHGLSRQAWQRYEQGSSWKYDVVKPGFKYNMTDIQAAIGIWQLKRFEYIQARRQEIYHKYIDAFKNTGEIELPVIRTNVMHAWHLFCIRLKTNYLNLNRDDFILELNQRQIGTSVHFIPIHLHSYYANKYGYKPLDFPVAFHNYERILSLPLNAKMSDDEVGRVIEAVHDIVCLKRTRLAA